jgi:peptidoglycan hydrolase-like protein with peptidoglycan-binding domain
MPSTQSPNYFVTGAPNAAFEAQRPFTIAGVGASGGSGSGSGTSSGGSAGNGSQPSTNGSHPTLRRGSRGPDVEILQQRLVELGWQLDVDGDFGPMTEDAVKEFQSQNGLDVDGIVGPNTWAALDARQGPRPRPRSTPTKATPRETYAPTGAKGAPAGTASGTSTGTARSAGTATATRSRPAVQRGDVGPDVRYLQQRLVEHGSNLRVDGRFSPATESAVRAFQYGHGLEATGVVDARTWSVIG